MQSFKLHRFLWALALLVALGHGEEYFIHLSKEGLKQRSALLSGSFSRQQFARSVKNSIRFKDIFGKVPSSKHFRSWMKITVDPSRANLMRQTLQKMGLIDYSEAVQRFHISSFSNDSMYRQQWYLNTIHAPEAWQITEGDSRIIVGVIDTGIDYHHPDLQTGLWRNEAEENGLPGIDDDHNGFVDDSVGWDFTDAPDFPDGGDYRQPDNDPMDEYGHGHGTEVAGIIAAVSLHGQGMGGIAPGIKVMNLRAGTAGGYLEEDDVANAILYAIDNGARIINMSFGDTAVSRFLKDIMYYAYRKHVLMVAASGNEGNDRAFYPAGLAETISVGASTINDYIAGFSSYGSSLDLVAPGDSILSTAIGGGYSLVNGTSFSAPMVSAAAGLILSLHPDYSVERLRNVLKTSCDDIMYSGWDRYSGSGRLNVARALQIPRSGELRIIRPAPNSSTAKNTLLITGTILHPDIRTAELDYALGNPGLDWQVLKTFNRRQVLNDTLAVLNLQSMADTVLTLRLKMELVNGPSDEVRRVVRIDRSKPVLSELQITPMYDGEDFSVLISFESDDLCTARIFIRPEGAEAFSDSLEFGYETHGQRIKLSSREFSGTFRFYVQATNLSGLSTIDDQNGRYYTFTLKPDYEWRNFEPVPWQLPPGFLLPESTDLDHDGKREVVLSRYTEQGGFGAVEIYEFETDHFEKRFTSSFPAIPRDAGDVNANGRSDLLLGYGQNTFVLEAASPSTFPNHVVWSDTGSFWGASFADLDQDGKGEIIGRIDSQYVVLEQQSDGQFSPIAELGNPTPGRNLLGTPLVAKGDFNNDGRPDLVFGDSDGDLIFYTTTGENQFTLLTTVHTDQQDATSLLSALNNGLQGSSLFAGSHSSAELQFEHEFDARHWSVDWFGLQDNRMVKKWSGRFFGFYSLKDFDSGIQAREMNGRKRLFLSLYPNLYIFKINRNQVLPIWHFSPAQSNTILIEDFDRNGYDEFYFNTGRKIIGYSEEDPYQPSAPNPFSATPLDSTRIYLKWQNSSSALSYQIYRGLRKDSLLYYKALDSSSYVDSGLANETTYFYAIRSIDSTLDAHVGSFSKVDSATTSTPPGLTEVKVLTDRQLQLGFNEEVQFDSETPYSIRLSAARQNAVSVLLLKDHRHILCGFSKPFLADQTDTVQVQHIYDVHGVEVDRRFRKLSFKYFAEDKEPYVAAFDIISRYSIELTFSRSMRKSDLLNTDNYVLQPWGSVQSVQVMDSTNTTIRLQLTKGSMAGSLGQPAYLVLTHLHSSSGYLLKETDTINLFKPVKDLSRLFVYPQPTLPSSEKVFFARIPENCEINIFNLQGQFIRRLSGQSNFGGMTWNLRDRSGRKVHSGIYLFQARHGSDTKIGKIVIVR